MYFVQQRNMKDLLCRLLFTLVSTVDPEEILTRERAMGEQGNLPDLLWVI